jgi:hypothetical protein
MLRKIFASAALSLFLTGIVSAADLSLEPCINGDVSPLGTAVSSTETD